MLFGCSFQFSQLLSYLRCNICARDPAGQKLRVRPQNMRILEKQIWGKLSHHFALEKTPFAKTGIEQTRQTINIITNLNMNKEHHKKWQQKSTLAHLWMHCQGTKKSDHGRSLSDTQKTNMRRVCLIFFQYMSLWNRDFHKPAHFEGMSCYKNFFLSLWSVCQWLSFSGSAPQDADGRVLLSWLRRIEASHVCRL